MPVIPLLYGLISSFMARGLYLILTKVLASVGIFALTYYLTDSIVDSLFSRVSADISSMPVKLFQLAGVLGVLDMINILCAFASMTIALKFAGSIGGKS